MKSVVISYSQSGTYADVVALVQSNNFGDQVITVIHEKIDGSKHTILTDSYPENNWLSDSQIKSLFSGMLEACKTLDRMA